MKVRSYYNTLPARGIKKKKERERGSGSRFMKQGIASEERDHNKGKEERERGKDMKKGP